MSGRITLHLDPGLGWTKPLTVACCATCGSELARHPNHDRASEPPAVGAAQAAAPGPPGGCPARPARPPTSP